MKGYKGFEKGLVCRGKQYAENTVYEEENAVICKSGMHYCKNPLDVLDYYPLLNDNAELNEYCEVEDLDVPVTDDNKKFATKKLKIGLKLSFNAFIKAAIDFVFESSKENNDCGDSAKLASSGDSAKLASSGYYAQLASSGDSAKLASSGDSAKLASSGNYAQIASSGNYAQLASSGNYAQLASSGNYAKLASSGNYAKLASSGIYAQLASSGNYAKLASSGNYAKLASSGDSAQLASSGKNSIVCAIGVNSIAKAAKGSWITLAEYDKNYIVKCVKTEKVTGKRIKADTWYRLRNGMFEEV